MVSPFMFNKNVQFIFFFNMVCLFLYHQIHLKNSSKDKVKTGLNEKFNKPPTNAIMYSALMYLWLKIVPANR